ncbi:MAG: ribonuclease D [Janthinobacterium lividum]
MILVNQQEILVQVCANLAKNEILSIDTEFERSTTYFSKLSTIQIASKDCLVVIDARANLDLYLFQSLLLNHGILKIFHSPREDFEIFYRLFKCLPQNIFDTQTASRLCGLGSSISYSDLCAQICNIIIDKTYQKANWLRRPLPIEMLEYATNDVKYLEVIYNFLQNLITTQGLQERVTQSMHMLIDPKNYKIALDNIWKKVNFANRSDLFLSRMKIIAAFREECASDADLPRKHFLSDEDLVKICNHLPTSNDELRNLKLNNVHIAKQKYKNRLLDLCSGLKGYK